MQRDTDLCGWYTVRFALESCLTTPGAISLTPKYFGLKKGIVSYALLANHVPVIARIIGANEHESHYVFDLLFNNTTDIRPIREPFPKAHSQN